jgi:hypothetical protein
MKKVKRLDHKKCSFCKKHISRRIEKYIDNIKQLANAKTAKRKKLLKKADPCLIKILCECAYNSLKNRIPLSSVQIKKLSSYVGPLITLARQKEAGIENSNRQRKLLQKEGGFLPIILPALISALGGIAGSAVSKLL